LARDISKISFILIAIFVTTTLIVFLKLVELGLLEVSFFFMISAMMIFAIIMFVVALKR